MSMKYASIAAAVAVALTSSYSALALDEATTLAAPNKLTVAGASAARDSFLTELTSANGPCVGTTVDVYRATAGDFRAYSCTLKSAALAPELGTIGGQNAVIYYRSEGGSAWGAVSLVPNNTFNAPAGSIKRLDVTTACVTTTVLTGGRPTHDCATTYNIANDSGTGQLVNDLTELAVGDVEPGMFKDTNYPSSAAFKPYNTATGAALDALLYDTGYDQLFGVFVNTIAGRPTNAITNLTKQDLAAIFSGAYSDWSQVPKQDNTGYYDPGQIIVCRREPGSGTQVIAAAKYVNVGCGGPSVAFVADTSAGTADGVVESTTTSNLETCVATNGGAAAPAAAIGINVFKTAPTNTRFVSINGVVPSKTSAALGQYPIWNELTLTKRPGLATSDARANILANSLITRTKNAASVPDTLSTFAIPSGTNAPNVPVDVNDPVALGTTNGSTCLPASGV